MIRCFVAASPYVASVDTEQGPVSSVFKIEFSMNLLLLWEQYKKCVRYSCTLRIKTKCYEAQTSRTSSFNLTEINVYYNDQSKPAQWAVEDNLITLYLLK